jgi:hypothetical protein
MTYTGGRVTRPREESFFSRSKFSMALPPSSLLPLGLIDLTISRLSGHGVASGLRTTSSRKGYAAAATAMSTAPTTGNRPLESYLQQLALKRATTLNKSKNFNQKMKPKRCVNVVSSTMHISSVYSPKMEAKPSLKTKKRKVPLNDAISTLEKKVENLTESALQEVRTVCFLLKWLPT